LLAGELSLLLLPQPAWLTDSHFPSLFSQEEKKKKKRNSNQQQQLLLLQPLEVPGIFPSVEFESADGTTGFSVF
jgi:hypothetical protein